jgi:hypothetical protein
MPQFKAPWSCYNLAGILYLISFDAGSLKILTAFGMNKEDF